MKPIRLAISSIASILALSVAFTTETIASCSDKGGPGVDWSGCKKSRKMLYDRNFSGARFDDTNFSLSDLDDSDFSRASLVKTDLTRASLDNANFELANLTKSFGFRPSFKRANFSATLMQKSEFSRAEFQGAKFLNVTGRVLNWGAPIYLGPIWPVCFLNSRIWRAPDLPGQP